MEKRHRFSLASTHYLFLHLWLHRKKPNQNYLAIHLLTSTSHNLHSAMKYQETGILKSKALLKASFLHWSPYRKEVFSLSKQHDIAQENRDKFHYHCSHLLVLKTVHFLVLFSLFTSACYETSCKLIICVNKASNYLSSHLVFSFTVQLVKQLVHTF